MNANVDLNRLTNLLNKLDKGDKISKLEIRWALSYVGNLKVQARKAKIEKTTIYD